MINNTNDSKLKHALSNRQVSMITLGGIVGAGLFVVSATALNTIGPAILLSYALTGIMVLFVMRMLGEMAIRKPDSGAFSTYASDSLGHWAGFTIGWLYWWFWLLPLNRFWAPIFFIIIFLKFQRGYLL